MSIRRDDNHILIDGSVNLEVVRTISSAIYQITRKSGFSDVTLDFSHTEKAFGSGMLPLIAMCQFYMMDHCCPVKN
jgi:hypothetical protein